MVRRILSIGLVLLLIGSLGTATAQNGPNGQRLLDTAYRLSLIDNEEMRALPDRPEPVQRLIEQYREGLLNDNHEQIAQLYTEDGRIYHASGAVEEGRQEIARNEVGGNADWQSVSWDAHESLYIGDDVIVEIGVFSGTVETANGETAEISNGYTAIDVKVDGTWKIKRVIMYDRRE